MEENVRSLLAQECFYFRTSLNWAVENELTLDKCLLVMVERGKASVSWGKMSILWNGTRYFSCGLSYR